MIKTTLLYTFGLIGMFYFGAKGETENLRSIQDIMQQGSTMYNIDMQMIAQSSNFYLNSHGNLILSVTNLPTHIPVLMPDVVSILNTIAANPEFTYTLAWNFSLSEFNVGLHTIGQFDPNFVDMLAKDINSKIQSSCASASTPPVCTTRGEHIFRIFKISSYVMGYIVAYRTTKVILHKSGSFVIIKFKLGSKAAICGNYIIAKAPFGAQIAHVGSAHVSPILTELGKLYNADIDAIIMGGVGGATSGEWTNLALNICS